MAKVVTGCLLLGILMSCTSWTKAIMEHRTQVKADFLHDERSPVHEEDFPFLQYYEPNKTAIVKADFIMTPSAEPFDMLTYSGLTRSYRQWGYAVFSYLGVQDTLSLYENMTYRTNPIYKDYLFLPFKDATNGVSTYGGGRYLNMSKDDTQDGHIVIDFNRCYNPWCAYSDGFNCPIPPIENHLDFPIEAGEKQYTGQVKGKAH